eukprot:TRINITY_DN4197_c0_g1_i1.p1 TRINITY_DN4197_c0_g1~~TRINITY_DN4197_c0_g1_i1.p1  ORF type:complete len:574 (+),score=57.56 TRINITY_DN4197_c0_g1_i1:565-2286(+)
MEANGLQLIKNSNLFFIFLKLISIQKLFQSNNRLKRIILNILLQILFQMIKKKLISIIIQLSLLLLINMVKIINKNCKNQKNCLKNYKEVKSIKYLMFLAMISPNQKKMITKENKEKTFEKLKNTIKEQINYQKMMTNKIQNNQSNSLKKILKSAGILIKFNICQIKFKLENQPKNQLSITINQNKQNPLSQFYNNLLMENTTQFQSQSGKQEAKVDLFISIQKDLRTKKKVIKLLVKQMGKNLLSGKSVINISMPVVVFSDSSVLGRLAECFVFAPNFFEKAGALSNPLDQFKQVLAFNIAVLHFGIEQTKPFNPILGETFQAFINGAPLYMEQICHHPPISALQVYGKNYYMDGKWELAANMHTNSLTGKQIGLGHIKFLNNQTEIFFSRPASEISGLLWGQRVVNYAGKSILYDVQNQLYCELLFHAETSIFSKSQHPIDYFKGAIYKVKKQFVEQLNELAKSYKNIDKMHALFKPKEHVIDIIHEISGIWHKYLQIDDERIWDFYQEIPHVILHEKHPLPSDSIYRKDLIMWQSRNYENAQAAKEELENIQRADRKFRAKFVEKNKKHK